MKTELRRRWSRDLLRNGNRALELGRLDQSPFGKKSDTELWDFRGLELSAFVKNRVIEGCDLSFARPKGFGQFAFCTLDNVLFCELSSGTNLGNRFANCNFERANLKDGLLRGAFSSCSFAGAKLHNTRGVEVVFEDVDFSGADFRSAELIRCTFKRCNMTGSRFTSSSLGGSRFEETELDGVELGDTLMEGVTRSP